MENKTAEARVLIAIQANLQNFIDKEFDDYLIVGNTPNRETLDGEANKILQMLKGVNKGETIWVELSAPPAYMVVLLSLKEKLKKEGITIDIVEGD